MKSCLGILIVFFTFVAVVGGGAFLYYLSTTSEFSRKTPAPSPAPEAAPTTPPKAIPVR